MKESEELIKLIDGAIINITQDEDYYSGCETCDYGSRYINEINIFLIKYIIHVNISQMYEYVFSENDMMKLFINNLDKIKQMTEEEFTKWFEIKMEEFDADLDYEVKLVGE